MMLRVAAERLGARLRAAFGRSANSIPRSTLTRSQQRLLGALLQGATLKSHRYLDGNKEYRLHPLGGGFRPVAARDVRRLEDEGLLLSNHKFPAATLFLSPRGREAAAAAVPSVGAARDDSAITASR